MHSRIFTFTCACVRSNSIIFFKLAHRYRSWYIQAISERSTERKVFHSVTVIKSSTSTKSRNHDLSVFPSSLNPAIEVNVKSSSLKMRYFDKRVGDIFGENVAIMEKRKWCNNAVLPPDCPTIITVTEFTILDLNHHQIASWHTVDVAFPLHVWTIVIKLQIYLNVTFSKWKFCKSARHLSRYEWVECTKRYFSIYFSSLKKYLLKIKKLIGLDR